MRPEEFVQDGFVRSGLLFTMGDQGAAYASIPDVLSSPNMRLPHGTSVVSPSFHIPAGAEPTLVPFVICAEMGSSMPVCSQPPASFGIGQGSQ